MKRVKKHKAFEVMDGYTKAAIKEAMAKRSPREVKWDAFMDRLINGPVVYVFAIAFWGLLGWVIFVSL